MKAKYKNVTVDLEKRDYTHYRFDSDDGLVFIATTPESNGSNVWGLFCFGSGFNDFALSLYEANYKIARYLADNS